MRTAVEDGEELPAASCCMALTLRVPARAAAPVVVHAHRPSAPTSARHTGERSRYTVRTAPGSPVPRTVNGCERTRSSDPGAVTTGAAGAVRSTTIVRGADGALRRSERKPLAVLAVWAADTVTRPSRVSPGSVTVQWPLASTRAVRSAGEPATDTATVAPGRPVPDRGPDVGRSVVTAGGTTTSDAGAREDPSVVSVSSVTVKTCCGPERTVAMHAHEPSDATAVAHPVEPVVAGPETRTWCPGVPLPWNRTVAVVTSPGSAMVGRTAGRSVGDGEGEPVSGGSVPNWGKGVGDAVRAPGSCCGSVVAVEAWGRRAGGATAAAEAGGAASRTAPAVITIASAAVSSPVRDRGRPTGPPPPTVLVCTLSPSVSTTSITRDDRARVNPPPG